MVDLSSEAQELLIRAVDAQKPFNGVHRLIIGGEYVVEVDGKRYTNTTEYPQNREFEERYLRAFESLLENKLLKKAEGGDIWYPVSIEGYETARDLPREPL
jgi:hypothetical protein